MARRQTRSSKKDVQDIGNDTTNHVTPSKSDKDQAKTKPFSLVVLNNGRQLPFTSLSYASIYEKTNATVISTIHRFHTEEEMVKFQSKMKSETKPEAKRGIDSVLSPEQKESLARMKRIKTTRHPHKAITLHYKTTPFSSACGVILDVVDYNGNTQWNFKASDHRENLLAYIECVDDVTGTYTKQLIQNLKLVERKDLTKAGENAPLKNKGGYNVCKMMTYFLLPENDPALDSEDSEKDHIERELHAFATELQNILTSTLYNEAMKDHVSNYSTKFLDTLYSPKKGPTLPDFIKSCSIMVQPLKDISQHIIKTRENEFEDILHRYDNPIPKFITDIDALHAEEGSGYSPHFHPDGGPGNDNDPVDEVEPSETDEANSDK